MTTDGTAEFLGAFALADGFPVAGASKYYASPKDGYGVFNGVNWIARDTRLGLLSEDGTEKFQVTTEDLVRIAGFEDGYWTFYSNYADGQKYCNVGKQMVVSVTSDGVKSDYMLLDFSRGIFEEVEYDSENTENLATNVEDMIVARYHYIGLNDSGRYLASDGERWFYIDSNGTVVKSYQAASEFVNGYAAVMEEDGLAYLIDCEFPYKPRVMAT